MTRRRANLNKSAPGSEDPHQDGRQPSTKNMPLPEDTTPKGPDFVQTVLSDNWKQRSLV